MGVLGLQAKQCVCDGLRVVDDVVLQELMQHVVPEQQHSMPAEPLRHAPATGGDATGGDATGGDATGGDATGGDATGGDATGGDAAMQQCSNAAMQQCIAGAMQPTAPRRPGAHSLTAAAPSGGRAR